MAMARPTQQPDLLRRSCSDISQRLQL